MADYTSGSMRVSGLVSSSANFDDMIAKLKKIEMIPANKLLKWKADWQERLDAFGQVRTKLASYSSALGTMDTENKFLVKNAVSSNTNALAATASAKAIEGTFRLEVNQVATNSSCTLQTTKADGSAIVNTGTMSQKFCYDYKGTTYTLNIPGGTTMDGLKNFINTQPNNPGVKANLIQSGGGVILQLYASDQGATDLAINDDTELSGFESNNTTPGNWTEVKGVPSQVKVNGWPAGANNWLENNTNVLTGAIEGVTVNLYSQGASNVTVGIDRNKIKDNIVKFVDGMNDVRNMIKGLTSVDANKTLADPKYTDSQFDMEKGGVLTGNYGIQLISSKLKTATMDQGKGFTYATQNPDKTFSGDLYSSLAQIGIYTDSKDGSPTFGLLLIDDDAMDKALEKDAQGVAELFSANLRADTTSNDFGVDAVLDGFTKAGKYDVKYTVAADGSVTGTINGKAAKYIEDTHQLSLVRDGAHPEVNDADGITLTIYNLTPNSTFKGEVAVKSGKISEIKHMIDVDFLDPDSGDTDLVKGTLSVLETQYKKIMSNIDKKVSMEDDRITLWERRTINRFARLDAVLSKYDSLGKQIDSQVKQLAAK